MAWWNGWRPRSLRYDSVGPLERGSPSRSGTSLVSRRLRCSKVASPTISAASGRTRRTRRSRPWSGWRWCEIGRDGFGKSGRHWSVVSRMLAVTAWHRPHKHHERREAPTPVGGPYINAATRGDASFTQPELRLGHAGLSGQPSSVSGFRRAITNCRARRSCSMLGGRRRSGPRRSGSHHWVRCRRSQRRRSRIASMSSFAAKCSFRECQRSGRSRATMIRLCTLRPVRCPAADRLAVGMCPPLVRKAIQRTRSREVAPLPC